MAQDPTKINPVSTSVKTYPGERLDELALPTVPELLPSIFRTDTNKKLIAAVMEDMFQPHAMEDLNYSVGRRTTKSLVNDYLPHPTAKRQLEPGLLVYRADNSPATLSADEVAHGWGLNDRTKETTVPVSILDLPIDPDKFINWPDYYWIQEGMPVIFITGTETETFDIQNDILGKPAYTTVLQRSGKRLELKNGMRVVFNNVPSAEATFNKPARIGTVPILSNFVIDTVTNGKSSLDIECDFVAYDRSKIIVTVDGIVKTFKVDYDVIANTIHWNGTVPSVDLPVNLNCVEYFLTTDEDSNKASRRWQIAGVGTAGGIRLLSRTHQYTNTRYSKAIQTLWDKTAVPWDSVEWDGAIKGINEKHYILEKVGARTRNTNSRVNVWYHKDTIQTTADYLNINFNDIVTSSGSNTNALPAQALRPIVEFDDTLELFNHGIFFRAWPNLVTSIDGVAVSDFINLPIVDLDLEILNSKYISTTRKLQIEPDIIVRALSQGNNIQTALNRSSFTIQEFDELLNTVSQKILYEVANGKIIWLKNQPEHWSITYRISGVPVDKLRILWLVNDIYKNKIINVLSNETVTNGFVPETARNRDAVLIDTPYSTDANYLLEYHWVNGQAILAQTRLSRTQQPLFELYDSTNVKLSNNPNNPDIKSSAIIEIVNGDKYDAESGYNLKFLPSQFSELTADNTASDAMYDIVYNHTLQNFAYYNQGTASKTVSGPYQFRRVTDNTPLINQLSIGYSRAWFRLKSWAIRTVADFDNSTVELDATMWPKYDWGIKVINNTLRAVYLDNFSIVAKNLPRIAAGESANFTVFVDGNPSVATISGVDMTSFDVDIVNNYFTFVVPADAPSKLTITIDGKSIQAKVIDVKQDPRNVKVKLNGLPVDYSFTVVRDSSWAITSVQLQADGQGTLEIQHQGDHADNDHITAIPGLVFNPEQNINLGEFTPSRLVHNMTSSINANKRSDSQSWNSVDYVFDADGAIMADNSSMRSAWTSFRLSPTIQDSVIARSLSGWRWWRKFISKLESNFNLLDFNLSTPRENLDRILEESLLGLTYSSPDAISGMAVSTNGMNKASYVVNNGTLTFNVNTGGNGVVYLDFFGPDIVYVYANGELVSKNDYAVDAYAALVTFKTAPADGTQIEIYHSSQSGVYSGIPASPAKLGLSGVYQPGFVTETWGQNTRKYIQRHDGSRIAMYGTDEDDLRNLVILELETRTYNNCIHLVGAVNQQRQYRAYRSLPILEAQAKAQIEWYTTNNIDYQERSDFDAEDAWTWNYNGLSWRAIYINAFDTYQLDTAPWESLGYDSAPTWWNNYYSWTDATKRSALENALRFGIVTEPGKPVTVAVSYRRNFDTFPVDQAGNLIDPVAWNTPAPSSDVAQQPWEIGSWSPVEVAWRRSIAGAWDNVLHAIEDYDIVHNFMDEAINPFVNDTDTNSPKQKGTNTLPPGQFFQDRPTIGMGSVLFEAYREFNLTGQAPLNELMSLDSRLQFGVGGFSDGVITLKMYYAKFKNGFYIPAEDFLMTLSPGVSTSKLRYSAVRVEKDGDGFRVYGFDPGHKYFTIFKPSAQSLTESYPTSRSQIVTPNGTFVSYSDWDNISHELQYGSYINDKQALFTFFEGLQKYQESQGLILDQVNSRGTITNWQQAGLDALTWIAENWGTDHFCLVGVATEDGLKFSHARGTLDRLDADLGRTGKVLFSTGRSALSNELQITREYEKNVDKIVPTAGQQIVFVNFSTRDYDHVVYINRKTKFGDLVIDLQTGNRIDVLGLSARRTNGWTGRPTARGVTLTPAGLIPGFDALVSDIVDSHKPEQNAFDSIKTDIAKSDVVPAKSTIIDQLIQDKSTQHFYKQGLQTAMGTNLAVDALLRNSKIDIPGRQQDIELNEQWLITTGNFGNLESENIWEVELRRQDFTASKQVVRFQPRGYGGIISTNNGSRPTYLYDSLSDNIIDIWEKDKRWVTKPLRPYEFATIDRSTQTGLDDTKNWLPNAGNPQLFNTDIEMRELGNLTLASFINVDQTDNSILANVTVDPANLLTTSDIFSTNGFSIYNNYQPSDLCWQEGNLYRAKAKITGSSTSVFDSTQWNLQPIDGRLLPNVWVSDYGFNINTKYKGSWTASTLYNVGDIIDINGFYNVCIKPHTSGSTFVNNSIAELKITQKGLNYQVGDLIKSGSTIVGNVSAVVNGTIKTVNVVDTVGGYNPETTVIAVAGGSGTALLSATYKNDTIQQTITGRIGTANMPTGIIGFGNNYTLDNTIVTVNGTGTGAQIVPIIEDNISSGTFTRYNVIKTFGYLNAGTGYAVGDLLVAQKDTTSQSATDAVFRVSEINALTSTPFAVNYTSGNIGLFSQSTPPLVAWVSGIDQDNFKISTVEKASILSGAASFYTTLKQIVPTLTNADIQSFLSDIIDSANSEIISYIGNNNVYLAGPDFGVEGELKNVTSSSFDIGTNRYTRGTLANANVKVTARVVPDLISQTDLDKEIDNLVTLITSNAAFAGSVTTAQKAQLKTELVLIFDLIIAIFENIEDNVDLYNYSKSPISSLANANSIKKLVIIPNDATLALGGQSYATRSYNLVNKTGTGVGGSITVTAVQDVTLPSLARSQNGVITGFTVTTPGQGYTQGTTISVTRRNPSRATAVITNGVITAINVLPSGQGSNILVAADIKVVINSGSGAGFTYTPNIVNGKLTSVTVITGGSSYSANSTVTIIDPYWTDADSSDVTVGFLAPVTLTVNRIGVIDKINVLDGGSGYTTSSIITITDATRSTALLPAVATVTATAGGAINSVVITNSSAVFDQIPTLTVTSQAGSGAEITASVTSYWKLKTTGYGWNILQTFSPMYVEETCPNALDTSANESKVTFADPHGLRAQDYIVMVGNNDGNYDKVHKVLKVVDDYNILIPARSSSDQIVYNTVAFKLAPVKFETIAEYNQSKTTQAWLKGMRAYIDNTGQGSVPYNNKFTVIVYGATANDDLVIESEARMTDPYAIHKVQILDEKTENILGTLEVYDPFKGASINEMAQYINHRQPVDPASYNVDELGVLNKFITMSWGKQDIGKTWWDTSRVRYIEYEQGSLSYRATNWGKQFADSEVVIYEWVSSVEEPTIDTPGLRLDDSSGIEQLRYSIIEEPQPNGGKIATYYYWQRGVAKLPTNMDRPYTSASIEFVLNDPDANGIAWMSPIQVTYDATGATSASIMIANISKFFSGRDKVILRIEQNKKPEQKHNTGILLTEGMAGSVIPDYPVTRLRDSLVGYDNYRMLHDVRQFVVGQSYAPGELITTIDPTSIDFTYTNAYGGLDIPVLPTINANREEVQFVWQDDGSASFGVFRVTRGFSNATSFDSIVNNLARFQTALVKNVLEENKYYAVIVKSRQVPDINLHPLRRYGNEYSPLPQSWYKNLQDARRTFVDVVNDKLAQVNAVDKFEWDKYLRIWQPLLGSKALDVTQYWYYVDYKVDDYSPGNEEIRIRSFTELLNYVNPTKFALVDSDNNIQSVYRVDNLDTNQFTLLYKKNGTIQFYPIWRTSGWDVKEWDGYPWDEGFTDIFAIILKALRENIFVGDAVGYFNLVFFATVKEALVQDPLADWIFKTTYLTFDSTSNNDLAQVPIYYDKKDTLIKKYITEVKPFHSEMLDRGTVNKSLQQVAVTLDENLELTIVEKNIIGVEPGYIRQIDRRRNGTPEPVITYDKLSTEDLRPLLINITTITQVLVDED